MKLNSLRDFMAVAERGSLRAAARQLGVTQPAITRSIQELEKELGVVLFERRAKGVSLTRMGEVFLRRSKAVRCELDRARDELDQLRGQMNGHICVCLSGVAHMAMLPSAMAAFRQRFPDVQLDIIDGLLPSVEAELKDGIVDCYIGPTLEEVSSELSAEKLLDSYRVIVGRHGHPLANARSLRELVDAEWVTTSVTYRAEEELAPLFASHGLPPPRLIVQARSALTFLFTVAYSDLLMLLPIQWTQTPLFSNALQPIHVAERLPSPPICIVQRNSMPLTPAAEYFCDMIRRASRHVDTTICNPFPGQVASTPRRAVAASLN
ncbi:MULTISPECIES: LysR substrate-binding domain-containing protein [unclassified Variovorax]|uniref:LysR substrate-binding domain-containing protein n=1 Tax=unclassified Variovorax TaxID=663243 RepID=UPI001BD69F4C|nr:MULTISPECIES: LysR substrate-binding domain-containing protein [unclassified Variovorax]